MSARSYACSCGKRRARLACGYHTSVRTSTRCGNGCADASCTGLSRWYKRKQLIPSCIARDECLSFMLLCLHLQKKLLYFAIALAIFQVFFMWWFTSGENPGIVVCTACHTLK